MEGQVSRRTVMTTTTAELVTYEDPVELAEHLAIAGFLAG